MKLKNEKGSITIFVLVGLLFMSAFLIISYASNVNKSKIIQEQSNIIDGVYLKNDNIVDSYTDAYSALRKKNTRIFSFENEADEDKTIFENTNTVELTETFEEKMNNYRIYGKGDYIENSNLPSGYQELEYIESTGTQYIDTNLYGSINTKVDIDIEIEDKTNSPIIGTDNFVWSREYVCQAYKNSLYSFKSKNSIDLGNNTRLKIHLDPNAQSTIENIGSVDSGMTAIANTKIYIAKWGSYLGIFKLYSCEFYENEILIRDFVPCYRESDKEVGLYDKVNDEFFTNQGTGKFKGIVEVGDLITDSTDSNYQKYNIPIKITNNDGESQTINIYLDKPLGSEEYIDFRSSSLVRNDGTEESIDLPELSTFEDYTKIEILTTETPSKIEVEYVGYTIE